ncbi:hypothetical protein ANO11243_006150 [Dothideomycetidae sp. 11243]|nr:hypothetical protein ANO11243_006150 [fungal sp. No.11243]
MAANHEAVADQTGSPFDGLELFAEDLTGGQDSFSPGSDRSSPALPNDQERQERQEQEQDRDLLAEDAVNAVDDTSRRKSTSPLDLFDGNMPFPTSSQSTSGGEELHRQFTSSQELMPPPSKPPPPSEQSFPASKELAASPRPAGSALPIKRRVDYMEKRSGGFLSHTSRPQQDYSHNSRPDHLGKPDPAPSQGSEAQDSPEDPLDPFDWDELEQRYHAMVAAKEEEFDQIWDEYCQLQDVCALTLHLDKARADSSRHKTQQLYVRQEEEDLDRLREHYVGVMNAFKSAMALLGHSQ